MSPTIENELAQAREQITRLESDASARDALLTETNTKFTEATTNATCLQARLDAIETERRIDAEALVQARSDIEAARGSIASLTNEKDALAAQLKEVQGRNAALEAAEKDLEKRASLRAAQIVAETGTQAPANVTPKGDRQTATILEQFQAITDPAAQTTFWRSLSTVQQDQILAQSKNL